MTNQATLVTGGTRGIGRALVLRFSNEGPVLFTARDEIKAAQLRDEIGVRGGVVDYCLSDSNDPAALLRLVREKLDDKGWHVRNLILNAGVSSVGPTAAIDDQVLADIFEINVFGPIRMVRAILPDMVKDKGGTICFMAGLAGIKGYRGMAVYNASKFALMGLAASLTEEVKKDGIRIVPVCPGPVDTDMTAGVVDTLVKKGMSLEDAKAKVAAVSGQKRLWTPSEIADQVAWACSPSYTLESGQPLKLIDN